jgi:hypothetical protein
MRMSTRTLTEEGVINTLKYNRDNIAQHGPFVELFTTGDCGTLWQVFEKITSAYPGDRLLVVELNQEEKYPYDPFLRLMRKLWQTAFTEKMRKQFTKTVPIDIWLLLDMYFQDKIPASQEPEFYYTVYLKSQINQVLRTIAAFFKIYCQIPVYLMIRNLHYATPGYLYTPDIPSQ